MADDATIALRGDNDPLKRALAQSESSIKRWGSGVSSTFAKVGGAIGAYLSVRLLANFTKAAIGMAVEAEDAGSAFDTVFGPAVGRMNKFVDEFAHKAGFASFELKKLLATSGNIVQGIGATADESAELAEKMARLAADVASFKEGVGSTPQALYALQSALTGERESLKQFGIVILETDVQAKAFAMTGKSVAKDLTKLEKAQATVALAYERAGKAVGDLSRTEDSRSNTLARQAARFREISKEIGDALLPALDALLPLMDTFADEIERSLPLLREMSQAMADWAEAMGGASDGLKTGEDDLSTYMKATIRIVAFIQTAWEALGENISTILGNIGKNAGEIAAAMVASLKGPQQMIDAFRSLQLTDVLEGTEGFTVESLMADFDKRVKDAEESRRGQQQDDASAKNKDGGFDGSDGSGDVGAGKKAKAGGGPGVEDLLALNARIQNAAVKPEDKIVGAIEKLGDIIRDGDAAVEEAVAEGAKGAGGNRFMSADQRQRIMDAAGAEQAAKDKEAADRAARAEARKAARQAELDAMFTGGPGTDPDVVAATAAERIRKEGSDAIKAAMDVINSPDVHAGSPEFAAAEAQIEAALDSKLARLEENLRQKELETFAAIAAERNQPGSRSNFDETVANREAVEREAIELQKKELEEAKANTEALTALPRKLKTLGALT
jgi:hypothetical protein